MSLKAAQQKKKAAAHLQQIRICARKRYMARAVSKIAPKNMVKEQAVRQRQADSNTAKSTAKCTV